MAAQGGRGKKGGSSSQRAGQKAHGKGATESGTCIICGEQRAGAIAKPEFPVRAARWLRAALGQPASHTIACSEHLQEARNLRAKFEKKQREYLALAGIFFIFAVGGSFFFNNSSMWVALPALIGALFVALLPSLYYFPKFG